jgi:hypothetical protein
VTPISLFRSSTHRLIKRPCLSESLRRARARINLSPSITSTGLIMTVSVQVSQAPPNPFTISSLLSLTKAISILDIDRCLHGGESHGVCREILSTCCQSTAAYCCRVANSFGPSKSAHHVSKLVTRFMPSDVLSLGV